MTSFEFVDEFTLRSPQIAFVSQPSEWCDRQLFDAAGLTLDLADELLEAGQELKDGSAWNVLFDGCAPAFCDLFSVQPLQSRRWWAFGQFARHFVFPLVLSKHCDLHAYMSYMVWRDGVTPDVAAKMLGWRRWLPRNALLLAQPAQGSTVARDAQAEPVDKQFRVRLLAGARWMLDGVAPRPFASSQWGDYQSQRNHYSTQAVEEKRTTVHRWLERIAPARAIDLGCNSGEFSRMAMTVGASVVAVDGDHEAVQRLYQGEGGARRLFPVVATLDDLHGGRGWESKEHPALLDRLQHWNADVVLILALIHHLMAAAIPLPFISRFVGSLTNRWLIIELIDESDTQLQLLCSQRRRSVREFGIQAQQEAFAEAGFRVVDQMLLSGGQRRLALLER